MRLTQCPTFEKIRHQTDVALEHADAGLDAASPVPSRCKQRRDLRHRDDIADKGRRIEAGNIQRQGIIRVHADRRGVHQEIDIRSITGGLPYPVSKSVREPCEQRSAPVGIDVVNDKFCHTMIEQRQGDRAAGATRTDQKRAGAMRRLPGPDRRNGVLFL